MAKGYAFSTDRPLYTNAVEKLRRSIMPNRRPSLDSGGALRGFRSDPVVGQNPNNDRIYGNRELGLTAKGEWDAQFGRNKPKPPAMPNPDPNSGQENGTAEVPPPGSFQEGMNAMLAPAQPANAAAMAAVAPRPYTPASLYKEAAQSHEKYLSDYTTTGRFGPQRTIQTKYGRGSVRSASAVDKERADILASLFL